MDFREEIEPKIYKILNRLELTKKSAGPMDTKKQIEKLSLKKLFEPNYDIWLHIKTTIFDYLYLI